MDDDEVLYYQKHAADEEKRRLGKMFEVKDIFQGRSTDHVVATTLFWKPAYRWDGDFPVPTKELMLNPAKYGLGSRYENPWEHYVEPVLGSARELGELRPEIVYRVYLAKDLEFLIPDLVKAGCEVRLMKSSSILHNPGAMWRFLAMEEDCLVTLNDSDRAREIIHDIERTELVAEGGLNYWRAPYFIGSGDADLGSPGAYRTSAAGQMGASKPLPVRLLAEAFIWNCEKGRLRDYCEVGGRRSKVFGSSFPEFGFDEFFLNAVIFPRIAFEGVLTFVHWKAKHLNHWFGLDIEYCTWANPKSEVMFFGNPDEEVEVGSAG